MLKFASLGSGSKGNATLIQNNSSFVLVDCGYSYKETCARLERLGVSASQIDALLITHEHTDHASGVSVLSRKHNIPVYLTRGTARNKYLENIFQAEYISPDQPFSVCGFDVMPVSVPHDANEPVQFIIQSSGYSLGILTDLGCITPHIVEHFTKCQALLLECNHDRSMLMLGPYHESLKQRVGSDWGHLSNEQAAELILKLDDRITTKMVIAHISEQNNAMFHVEKMLSDVGVTEKEIDIIIAKQTNGFDWLHV